MKLFLAPHNDDETLFGSFLCQMHHPLVIVCLRSFAQERAGIKYDVRERETSCACDVLGVDYEQWTMADHHVSWSTIEDDLCAADAQYQPSEVFAPAVNFDLNGWREDNDPGGYGLYHHDKIGSLAAKVFGDRCTFYTTYTRWNGREEGEEIEPDAAMIVTKLAALRCYQSQIQEKSTRMHFLGSLREYVR